MKEILQEYALIAEIISAIAIVISLVFIGFQIKDNTKATQASMFQEIAALDIQILLSMASSKESAKIITSFRESPETLSEVELNQGFYLFAAEIRHVENLFLQHENKMLPEKGWEARKALVEGIIQSPGFGVVLKSPNRKYFNGSFIKFGETLRAESK